MEATHKILTLKTYKISEKFNKNIMEATGTHPLSAADPLYVLILQWIAACKDKHLISIRKA